MATRSCSITMPIVRACVEPLNTSKPRVIGPSVTTVPLGMAFSDFVNSGGRFQFMLRCHLPKAAVWWPCCFSSEATVSRSRSMRGGEELGENRADSHGSWLIAAPCDITWGQSCAG